jgi:beta-glucanase (GH16 family)
MSTTISSRHWFWLCLPALAALGCASMPQNNDAGAKPATDTQTPTGAGKFALAWEDNFDSFDASRWSLMTHSWDGNLAQFSVDNTRFQDGIASLLLTRADGDTKKPFRGIEMRSKSTITYGKVETRARFAKGGGVISAAVLIYTPWPADDWNELDMEYLAGPGKMQFNTMVYTGAPVAKPATVSVSPTQFPKVVDLGFDATADFHVYTMEWTPSAARFLVDGAVKHEWNDQISLMKLPQNLLLTIWASSAATWAGAIGDDTAPTQADFDWVRVYNWTP